MDQLTKPSIPWLLMLCLLALGAHLAWSQEPPGDGQFDWPMGSTGPNGDLVLGHNHRVMQNFHNADNQTYPNQIHAGIDLCQMVAADTADDPVYAVADGVVACTNQADHDRLPSYPGKVVVIEHELPDGSTVYSQYGHLNYCNVAEADCAGPGERFDRGQEIGTILPWPGNLDRTHLHFEIRTFVYWDHRTDEPTDEAPAPENSGYISCAGRGYSPENQALDPGYLDLVAFIHSHRPPFPAPVATWSEGEYRKVRSRPSVDEGDEVGKVATDTVVTAKAIVRDVDFECDTDCYEDCNCDTTECDWWYLIDFEDMETGEELEGYVKSYEKSHFGSKIFIGEPYREGEPWEDPESQAIIELPFIFDELQGRTVPNQGSVDSMDGYVEGALLEEPFDPHLPDSVVLLDGATSYVEVQNSTVLSSSDAFYFSIWVKRKNNDTADVVAGQWHSGDTDRQRWLVTFVNDEDGVNDDAGELRFTVRLEDDTEVTARFVLPDCEYLDEWVEIAGSYDPGDGIRLYWDDRQVAHQVLESALAEAEVPLRIGSTADGAASDLDRFDGPIYLFRFWHQLPNTVDVVLIIDSSGSMSWNDPDDQRLNAGVVYLIVSRPGDFVGLIDFDSNATILASLLRLPDERSQLEALIHTIDASGGTHLGAGVTAACDVLTASTSSNLKKAAILLTDGIGTYLGNENQCFVDSADWTLHAFGFGAANLGQLEAIVANTGGSAQMVPDPESVVCEFQRMRATLAGVEPDPCTQCQVYPGQTVTFTVNVPPNQSLATFTTSWPGSDVVMTLTTPSGRVIDRATSAPDVTHDLGSTFEVYTITNPEPGEWLVSLYGADLPAGGELVTFGSTTIPAPPQPGNSPPDIGDAIPSVSQLWPPNHKMVPVEILDVVDPDGDPVTISVTAITQDEPVPGPGNRHSPDGEGVGTGLALLRAERDGNGNGRIYEISFTATDDKGAGSSGSVWVCVPHDQGGDTLCVDDGQIYDSTIL